MPRWPRRFSWDWGGVVAGLIVYAAVVTYLSSLRSENFFTGAWDLGINQQLLWTTAHGRLLYEAADLEVYGTHSFLQIHSTYVAFLVAPLYGAWPIPLTLFGLQAAGFASSGILLYLLARSTLQHRPLAFAVLTLYLASFAILAGLMFDFHWEVFLPAEFLAFYLLVYRRRYLLSLLPLALGTLTLEVFSFLAAAVLVLVLFERGQTLGFRWRPVARDQTVRMALLLIVVALVAYGIVRLFQFVVVPGVLGVASVGGGGPQGANAFIGFGANQVTFPHSMGYWLLLLASLAFLPLLSPRHLILSAPWFYFSVFVSPEFSSYFGSSQVFIAMPALIVAATFGLAKLERLDWEEVRTFALIGALLTGLAGLAALALLPSGSVHLLTYTAGPWFWIIAGLLVLASVVGFSMMSRNASATTPPSRRRLGRRTRRAVVPATLAAIVFTVLVLDTTLSPFPASNFGATPLSGYDFRFGENPTATEMPWLLSHLPADAQVLASNRLFSYVANDPNAWPVPWFVISAKNPAPYFPFTPSNLPQYVLADAQEFYLIPPFLQSDLFNGTIYGLSAYIYASWYPGTIYLFERGYAGSTASQDLGAREPLYVYSPSNLTVGPSGTVVPDPTAGFGSAIVAAPAVSLNATTAEVWSGPGDTFLPGNYTLTFWLKGSATNSSAGTSPIALLDATWTGVQNTSAFFRFPLTASQLSPTLWTRITVMLELAYPYPSVEFQGFLSVNEGKPMGTVELSSVVMTPQPA